MVCQKTNKNGRYTLDCEWASVLQGRAVSLWALIQGTLGDPWVASAQARGPSLARNPRGLTSPLS